MEVLTTGMEPQTIIIRNIQDVTELPVRAQTERLTINGGEDPYTINSNPLLES